MKTSPKTLLDFILGVLLYMAKQLVHETEFCFIHITSTLLNTINVVIDLLRFDLKEQTKKEKEWRCY